MVTSERYSRYLEDDKDVGGETTEIDFPYDKYVGKSVRIPTIYKYKIAAKHRGIVFNLTEEEFHDITKGDCYYCVG